MSSESSFGTGLSSGSSCERTRSDSVVSSSEHNQVVSPVRDVKEIVADQVEVSTVGERVSAQVDAASRADIFLEVVDEEKDDEGEVAESEANVEPFRLPPSYWLGRSQVTEESLDRYMADGLISSQIRSLCRATEQEEVPEPKPYEAVVFHDFFVVGLRFPCENLLSEVLERFNLQLHQLTPNAFSRLGIFAMALKMMGCQLNVNTFTRYYESQLHEKVVTNRRTKLESRVEFGSYNFVPIKARGTISIIPAYRNKWPQWMEHWFYIRVCSDEAVTEALANNLLRANSLVSQLTPMDGARLADCFNGGAKDEAALEAFVMTAQHQISHDLVEEWVALDLWPLSSESNFASFAEMRNYKGPVLNIRKLDGFSLDFDYVRAIESEANKIVGPYSMKEHETKCRGLAGLQRLNRVFDAMGLTYPDRMNPSVKSSEDGGGRKGRSHRGHSRGEIRCRGLHRGRGRSIAALESRKRKRLADGEGTSEPEDVQVGQLLAKAVQRRSKKVVIGKTRRFGMSSTELVAAKFCASFEAARLIDFLVLNSTFRAFHFTLYFLDLCLVVL